MLEDIVLPLLLVVIIIIITSNGIKIVPLQKVLIIEKLGVYEKTLEAGIHWIIPFVCRVVKEVDLGNRTYETNEGTFRTLDDQTVTLKSIVSFEVKDPKLYHYGFKNDLYEVQEIMFDKLRYVILQNTFQDLKMDLLDIESQLRLQIIDKGTAWGLDIQRVQISI